MVLYAALVIFINHRRKPARKGRTVVGGSMTEFVKVCFVQWSKDFAGVRRVFLVLYVGGEGMYCTVGRYASYVLQCRRNKMN